MSDEVVATEAVRVRPVVPPRPEFYVVLEQAPQYTHLGGWGIRDGGENLDRIHFGGHPYDIIRIPSESECAYLKRRDDLLKSIVNYLRAGDPGAASEIVFDLDQLDAEWEKQQGNGL